MRTPSTDVNASPASESIPTRHEPAAPVEAEPAISSASISRAIYGLITVLAVLSIMDAHPPTAWAGAASLFATTFAVALVDAYALTVAAMLAHERSMSRSELREIWSDVTPVLIGAQAPTVVMFLAVVDLISVEQAIRGAQAVAFVLLFGYGIRVGRMLHESWTRQLISGLMLFAIGWFIVGFKAAVH